MAEQWKKSFLAAAARAEVDGYFKSCLGLLEAGQLDDAEHKLSRSRWRSAVDLSAVPNAIVDATDALCADAVGLIEYGHTEPIARVVRRILSLWQIADVPGWSTDASAMDQLAG